MYGVIDSGLDIMIMCGTLLHKVAVVAKLHKKDLKPLDKTPCGYDWQPFKPHEKIDLTISFEGKVLTTLVYIKTDTEELLLLSEAVCRQLGMSAAPEGETENGLCSSRSPELRLFPT